MKPYESQNCNTLILPDIHQNLSFAETAIQNERGNFEQIICLGDYFDGKLSDDISSPKKTCNWLLEKKEEYGESIKFLIGNHDIQYYEYTIRSLQPYHKEDKIYFLHSCSGFSKNKAQKISQKLGLDFWKESRLFYLCNGYLLSHAGVHKGFWNKELSIEENLMLLNKRCDFAELDLQRRVDEIIGASIYRGGNQKVGGLIWLDWHEEFEDLLPLPQIVGHSKGTTPRRNGNSFCIDCSQKFYGLLEKNGTFHVKNLNGNSW